LKKLRDVVPTEQQDSFLRVYPRVLADTDLNPLQKLILSDILSYQLRGQSYFKSSSEVGELLGGYKTKTIQSAFQQLAKLGYITSMIKEGNKKNYTLRYASVVDMEYWVQSAEFLKGRKRKVIVSAPSTDKNEAEQEQSPDNASITNEQATQILRAHAPTNINEKPQEIEGVLFINIDFISHSLKTKNDLLELEEQGEKLNFIQAALFDKDGVFSIEPVIRVNVDGKGKYLLKSFVYNKD
jgi:hypothetical protein